jgi:hypothetical protein
MDEVLMRHRQIRGGWLIALLLAQAALGAEDKPAILLTRLVQQAVTGGQAAVLSPHLSVLLGISSIEGATPVRQLGMQSGDVHRLFDVCANSHDKIVLMDVVADKHVSAYLLSPSGVLLKAVAYDIGGPTHEQSLADAKPAFMRQREFWLAQARALDAPH